MDKKHEMITDKVETLLIEANQTLLFKRIQNNVFLSVAPFMLQISPKYSYSYQIFPTQPFTSLLNFLLTPELPLHLFNSSQNTYKK